MNRRILIVLLLLVSATSRLVAQGTAFNYQGRLNDGGAPATASYDFRFVVYDAVTNGNAISLPLTNSAVGVTNGLFSVTLDFGAGVFAGTNVWLDLAVRAVTVTNFTALLPRQPVLPVPYAIFATGASNLLGKLSAAQISGTLPASQLAGTSTNYVNFTNVFNTFVGSFAGNGSNLISLNAGQLTTGTVADARLTTNVALLDHNQTFSGINTFTASNQFNGVNTFTNMGNSFSGSFFGNGLVGWVVVTNAAVTADIDHGYVLTSAQFTTVTMPPTPNVVDIVRISGAGAGGWRAVANTNQSFLGNFSSFHNSVWLAATTTGVSWHSLAASADGVRMYAAGDTGVFKSTDAGNSWSQFATPTPIPAGSWNGVACAADGVIAYAVEPGKAIWYTTDGGNSWAANPSTTGSNCIRIACSASGTKAVIITKGENVLTNNSVGNWVSIGASSASTWIAAACSGNGNVCAAGNTNGNVYSSVAGNQTVTNKPITGLVISADGARLVACALGGGIAVSTNSGAAWNLTSAPLTNWNCLAASADCTRLVAGVSNGVLYASANFGGTWTPLAGSTNFVWAALASSADGTKQAGAVNTASGGIYYSTASSASSVGTNTFITGSQGSAVELQYLGNGQFMPVSSTGSIWAN